MNKPTFLSYWLRTLVEREATLQHQHEFTNALLNVDHDNPVLQNLPFARTEAGIYRITLRELEARRLSLIGSTFTKLAPVIFHANASYSKLYWRTCAFRMITRFQPLPVRS